MRVAVISDIHGNAVAFDAVLADISAQAVERVVCLGDAVQGGAQPVETVARLRELACPVVLGNADDFLLAGAVDDGEPVTAKQLAVRDWSFAQLSQADRDFIAGFAPTVELDLGSDRRLLCFHGSPASFGDILFPETPEEEYTRLLCPHVPALMTGGHTHVQQLRRIGPTFFFNPGSVGLAYNPRQTDEPIRADPWAEYAVLDINGPDWAITFRRVPFDVAALVEVTLASGSPGAADIVARYEGV